MDLRAGWPKVALPRHPGHGSVKRIRDAVRRQPFQTLRRVDSTPGGMPDAGGSRQLVDQRLRRLHIGGILALDEPFVDRREKVQGQGRFSALVP